MLFFRTLSVFFYWLLWICSGGVWNPVCWPGIEPGPLHWECRVLVTGPPRKSLDCRFDGVNSPSRCLPPCSPPLISCHHKLLRTEARSLEYTGLGNRRKLMGACSMLNPQPHPLPCPRLEKIRDTAATKMIEAAAKIAAKRKPIPDWMNWRVDHFNKGLPGLNIFE